MRWPLPGRRTGRQTTQLQFPRRRSTDGGPTQWSVAAWPKGWRQREVEDNRDLGPNGSAKAEWAGDW
jgi:hypothetical protein